MSDTAFGQNRNFVAGLSWTQWFKDGEACILAFPIHSGVTQWPKMPLFKCWRHNVSQHLQPEILQIISSLAHPFLWGHLLALTNWCWWRYNLFQTSFDSHLPHFVTFIPPLLFTARMYCRDKRRRVVAGKTNAPAECLESVAKQCGGFWFTITSSDRQLVAISVVVWETERANGWVCAYSISVYLTEYAPAFFSLIFHTACCV